MVLSRRGGGVSCPSVHSSLTTHYSLFFSCLASLILTPSVASADSPIWHLPDWRFRQTVELLAPPTDSGTNTGLVEVVARPPDIAADGRDVRVLDDKGRPVKFQWVREDKDSGPDLFSGDRPAFLHFEITGLEVSPYLVYCGNSEALAAESSWEKKIGGLTLETRVNTSRTSAANWSEMTALLTASKWKYGEGPRREINDPENPFGPNDQYISIYRGTIHCPVTGTYLLATDSDDASFLFIDGNLVVQWPGGHNPSGRFNHFAGMELQAGLHKIEYYHVQAGGGSLARAGWRPPGAEEFVTIPPAAFARELRTRTVAFETRDSSLNAFFTTEMADTLQFGSAGPVFATVAFRDCSRSAVGDVIAWEWDFGDGHVAREANPRHVFPGGREYKVALRCVDSLGYESVWTRTILPGDSGGRRADVAMEVATEKSLLQPDETLSVSIKLKSSGPSTLDLTWATAFHVAGGGAVHHEREPLTLEPGVWQTRAYSTARDGAGSPSVGDTVFRVEYLGEAVIERAVAIRDASDPTLDLRVGRDSLTDAEGTRIVLRLAAGPRSGPAGSVRRKLREGGEVRLLAVDDTLAGVGEAGYLSLLADHLQRRFPKATVESLRVGAESGAGTSYASLHSLVEVPLRVKEARPDVVIIAASIRDILRFTPVDRFERMLHALVDRIGAVAPVEIVLIAPPPAIANPGLAKAYAMAIKRVGLVRGVRVADAYSAFKKAGSRRTFLGGARGADAEEGWEEFYRDPDVKVPLYHVSPTLRGQELIAAAVADALLSD